MSLQEHRNNRDRPKLTVPPKPKAWAHQDDLREMIGKKIQITLQGSNAPGLALGIPLVGTLVAADTFTLKIDGGGQSAMTYFKHALTSYAPAK